jgi:hypothetical protein
VPHKPLPGRLNLTAFIARLAISRLPIFKWSHYVLADYICTLINGLANTCPAIYEIKAVI